MASVAQFDIEKVFYLHQMLVVMAEQRREQPIVFELEAGPVTFDELRCGQAQALISSATGLASRLFAVQPVIRTSVRAARWLWGRRAYTD